MSSGMEPVGSASLNRSRRTRFIATLACQTLAIDAATLEAEKPERDSARRENSPLNGIHGVEIAHQLGPGIEEPSAEGESRERPGEHDGLVCRDGKADVIRADRKPAKTIGSATLGCRHGQDARPEGQIGA